MALDEGLEVPVRVVYDPSGLDKAKKDLEDAGKTAKDSGEEANAAAKGWEFLADKLKELVALGEVIAFLRDSWHEIYEEEKAMRSVSLAADKYGMEHAKLRKEVNETAEAMAMYAGVADNEVTRSIGKQLLITGDLEQAQARAASATLLAAKMGISYGEAEGMITAATIGRTRSLERQLGIHAQGTTQEEKAASAIKQMNDILKKATTEVNDHALAFDRANTRMDLFKKQVGEQIAPSVVWMKTAFMDATDWIVKAFETAGAWIIKTGTQIGNFVTMLVSLPTEGKKAWVEFQRANEEAARDFNLTIGEINQKHADDEAARNKAMTAADLLEKAKRLAANRNLGKEEQQQEKEVHDYTLELLRSRAAVAETELKKLEAEYEIYAKEREHAELAIWASGVNVEKNLSAIKQIEINKRLAAEKKYAAEVKKILDGITDEFKDQLNERLAAERKTAEVTEQLRRQGLRMAADMRRAEMDGAIELGNTIVAFGETVFGKNKAVAVASSLINTFVAYTKTISMTGWWGIPLAVATLALGLAQVAKIISTKPNTGGGFDDPGNDMAAYRGGRKWAKDMVHFFSGGATDQLSRGWASGLSGSSSTTNDNRKTYNVHLHNVGLFDPSNRGQLTRLKRGLEQLDRDVEKRLITGRS